MIRTNKTRYHVFSQSAFIMKSFIYYLLAAIFICSCSDTDKDYQLREKARNSGIVIDTIVQGICFNDSPSEVQRKIKEAEFTYITDEYFLNLPYPSSFKNGSHWYVEEQWYRNDSLFLFSIRTNISSVYFNECLQELDSLYSYKYGEAVHNIQDSDIRWYKGNLTVDISTDTDINGTIVDCIRIKYKDSRFGDSPQYWGKLKESDYDQKTGCHIWYWYTPDYWNRTYQPEIDKKLQDAAKNI